MAIFLTVAVGSYLQQRGWPAQPLVASPFSFEETKRFLDAAQQAETITDPLQRCLSYPDPPRSHWSRRTVEAYCRYRSVQAVSAAEVKELVAGGRVADLEQRLAAALNKQRTDPAAHGWFDQIYYTDFRNDPVAMRSTLDSWKQQSPDSGYALAASGVAFVAQAWLARGENHVGDPPPANFPEASRLLDLALIDLEKAERRDPRLTPVYASLIDVYVLQDHAPDARGVVSRGLGIDPWNYWIYARWVWMSRPAWGGSLRNMRDVTARAQAHVQDNPLLALLLPEADAIANNVECSCRTPEEVAAFPKVFDQAGGSKLLAGAGMAADNGRQRAMGVIYLSEALRFDTSLVNERGLRINELVDLGRGPWARAEADRMVAIAPHDKYSYTARAYYYRKSANDPALAEPDLLAALAIAPDDPWILDELGESYVHRMHQWDKGWDIADRLIRSHPEDPNGWLLRASIQKDQPRAGLHETLVYFLAHFANDPNVQSVLPRMRAELQREAAASGALEHH